ncbi:MAG TPA: response regulator transcription factor [Thermoanaerobaculia bacterium]|jgi:DNA-binding NarL/FixJ family response regulator
MKKLNVFLVDDHAVLRHGLRMLIDSQPDMCVAGESERGRNVVEELRRHDGLDVVILDISMPDISGASAAPEIRAALPHVKIVALTRHAEKAYVQQMLQAGATGYVLKQTAADVLIAAIRSVASGGTYIDPAVAGKLLDSRGHSRVPEHGTSSVTPREREIATMVAYGHTNKEIAVALGITVKTVETHKSNIMQKLELTSRAELVRFAMTQGWLEK